MSQRSSEALFSVIVQLQFNLIKYQIHQVDTVEKCSFTFT